MNATAPWEQDEPTLSEQSGIRYLHFGTEWIQGAMHVRKPDDLVLAYTKQMMAWLLFKTPGNDDTLGILGLGAGALLRFALRHTSAHIETVEWNPAVTAICRMWFRLPEHVRSTIVHLDAGDWVQTAQNTGRYTALMVDLYDRQAQGPVRDSLAFYQGCHRTLLPGGVLSVNLFGAHDSFAHNMDNIHAAFANRVLTLPEVDAGNRIVLAFKATTPSASTTPPATADTGWPEMDADSLLARAQALEVSTHLPALRWARHLLAQRDAIPYSVGSR